MVLIMADISAIGPKGLITLTSKAPPRDLYPMYPMVHQDKLVLVLHGTPSKLVVTVVQQLVLKNGYTW